MESPESRLRVKTSKWRPWEKSRSTGVEVAIIILATAHIHRKAVIRTRDAKEIERHSGQSGPGMALVPPPAKRVDFDTFGRLGKVLLKLVGIFNNIGDGNIFEPVGSIVEVDLARRNTNLKPVSTWNISAKNTHCFGVICRSIIVICAVDTNIVSFEFITNKGLRGLDPFLLPLACSKVVQLVVGVEN